MEGFPAENTHLMRKEKLRYFGRDITRRDFLNGVALGSGSALLGAITPALARPAYTLPRLSPEVDW